MKREDVLYLAGFVDGEATIGITKARKKFPYKEGGFFDYRPHIGISNTNEAIIRWVKDTTGVGYIFSRPPFPPRKGQWIWQATGRQAALLITELCPFLRVKKEIALLVTLFYSILDAQHRERMKGGQGTPVKKEHWEIREAFYLDAKKLNKKGVEL